MVSKRTIKKIPLLSFPAGLMILILLIVAAGCTGTSPGSSGQPLTGTEWTLTDYVSGGKSLQTLDGTRITISFGDGGQITGTAGCNHYFARYEMKGTAITIGQAGSTEMACMADGVMEQESTYLTLLGKAASVTTGNDRLTFADATGTTILSYARIVPPAQEPLAGTNWTLDSFYTGDAVSSVISGTTITAVFNEEGRVSGSAGCNHYFGTYTVTGKSLSISSIGSTRMNCSGRGVMLQESTYLASISKAASFTISGTRAEPGRREWCNAPFIHKRILRGNRVRSFFFKFYLICQLFVHLLVTARPWSPYRRGGAPCHSPCREPM